MQKVITVVVRNDTGDQNFVEHTFPKIDDQLKAGFDISAVHQTVDSKGGSGYTTLTFILDRD